MKARILLQITILFLLAPLLFCAAAFAQEAPNADKIVSQNNAAPTQVLGEDERIPFMQNMQTEETVKQNETGSGSLVLRTFGAMFLIVGLIFAGAWTLKKLGYGVTTLTLSDAPELSVINTVSLGSGKTLSTVRFGDKILLVGSTAQSFTLLAEDRRTGDAAQAVGSFDSAETFDGHNFQKMNPRSVADLLADEDFDFETEFLAARTRLELSDATGGNKA